MNLFKLFAIACVLLSGQLQADEDIVAKYLANAGVLITHGETKIVFDPLFDNGFNTYELVPKDIQKALFDGAPPFDGLDAVFVSHNHGDHFSPERMVQLLRAHPDLQLFGPRQAIDAMPVDAADVAMADRLHVIDLTVGDQYMMTIEGIEVNAVRIPHSGWPNRYADIENISFKVSLNDAATVLHMGDAHTDPEVFDRQAEYWAERQLDLAMPPYWYFTSGGGIKILEDHIQAGETIGVHVPANMPDSPAQYPDEFQGRVLFSIPGEEKRISVDHDAK
jgi:L-ascorbate metabolism protein UlaG (beta-lactamase superfamily)